MLIGLLHDITSNLKTFLMVKEFFNPCLIGWTEGELNFDPAIPELRAEVVHME